MQTLLLRIISIISTLLVILTSDINKYAESSYKECEREYHSKNDSMVMNKIKQMAIYAKDKSGGPQWLICKVNFRVNTYKYSLEFNIWSL